MTRSPFPTALLGVVLGALLAPLTGCQVGGFIAHGLGAPQQKIDAKYTGLENHSVAVLVAVSDQALYQYPAAQASITRAVSAEIAKSVKGAQLASPDKVQKFVQNNPYWIGTPNGDLLKRLGVDRLVIIDVDAYSTHEPGNGHQWRGLITAMVSVAAADAADPNSEVFSQNLTTNYPEKEDTGVGVINSNDETMQLAMLQTFARDVSWLFAPHEVEK